MKSVHFEQANLDLAADQPEYETLPVCQVGDEQGQMICCFELSEEEKAEVMRTGRIWYRQLTFDQPFHPMLIEVENPFVEAEDNRGQPRTDADGRGPIGAGKG